MCNKRIKGLQDWNGIPMCTLAREEAWQFLLHALAKHFKLRRAPIDLSGLTVSRHVHLKG